MTVSGKFFIPGSRGMVGSAMVRRLKEEPCVELLTPHREELDCADYSAVEVFVDTHRPDYVITTAARVGGISENMTHPAQMIYENLAIQTNLIHLSHLYGAKCLVFLSSSCVYPREAPQPMREDTILTGPLEPTNAAYAMAKLAGMAMVEAYNKQYGLHNIVLIPATLIGPGEDFDLERVHVMPALAKRFCDAHAMGQPPVTLRGTGTPTRELMHVDDLVDAILFVLGLEDAPLPLNVGTGVGHSIADLAQMVAEEVGYAGEIRWDASRPDGMPAKVLSTERMSSLGWRPRRAIREGIRDIIEEYREVVKDQRSTAGGPLPTSSASG